MLWKAYYTSNLVVDGFTNVFKDCAERKYNDSMARLDLYPMHLSLSEARGFADVIRSRYTLVYLYVYKCVMSVDAWSLLVDALQHSRSVRRLALTCPYDEMCHRAATLERLTHLENLCLDTFDEPASDDGGAHLATTLATTLRRLTSLTRLGLRHIHLPSSRHLAAALPASLRHLDLVNSTSGDAFGELLSSSPSSLRVLTIHAYTRRVDVDVDNLVRSPPALTQLRFENVVLDDADAHSLATWLCAATSTSLRSLVLRDNNFSDYALPALEHAIRHTRAPLEHIDISKTRFNDDDALRLPSFRTPGGMPLQRFTATGAHCFVDVARDVAAWRLSRDDTRRLHETIGAFACCVLRRFARPSNAALDTLTLYRGYGEYDEMQIQSEIDDALARAHAHAHANE